MKLISLNIEGQKHLPKVRAFLEKEKADVVCLQECFEDNIGELVGDVYPHRLYAPSYVSDQDSTRLREWGEVILSKFPLTDTSVHYLEMDGYGPANLPRAQVDAHVPVLLTAKIQGVCIATIHFTWTPNASITKRQRDHVKQLRQMLGHEETVLCGDFNIPRGNEMYRQLANKWRDNIPPEIETTLDPELHYANKEKVGKLKLVVDYMWSTPQYSVSNVQVVAGVSDHCAVVASVEKI